MTAKRSIYGFTIVEVIVTIALFAIVLSVILFLYSNYGSTFFSQQAIISAANGARSSMEEIQTESLQASQVMASRTFTSPFGIGTVYTSTTTSLVLQLPSIDSTGELVSGKNDYVVFYPQNNGLYEWIQSDASSSRESRTRLLTGNLSSLSFSYNSATAASSTMLTVDLTTQATARGSTYTTHLQEPIRIRNQQ